VANILGTESNFKSLSMKDLLEARDLYHYHLMNKPNVVGTAVGLYFIRNSEPYPDEEDRHGHRARGIRRKQVAKHKGQRRLDNSGVRDYSWPCVHAFVCEWVDESKFGNAKEQLHPEAMVPKTLYMPDGRMVPVCVTLVQQGAADETLPQWQWPGGVFGGGMPILVRTQERERIATAGGLVTDGHKVYALTSRHVSGEDAETVYTLSRGGRTPIGHGSALHLARLPFTDVYPEFPGRRTYVNLDVGLIELDDVNAWTSRYLDLGSVEALADLNELNISVRLIDAPVVAVGAASGRLEGRIKALFYRFKSVGGYDYISDFLIAPRDLGEKQRGKPQTRPGDSGAVWHLVTHPEDNEPKTEDDEFRGTYRPLAVEWGGQVFLGSTPGKYTFGLATNLTTVCHALNVELVLARNVGALPYWGQLGHYSIGTFACTAVTDAKLKSFVSAHVEQISFRISELDAESIRERIKSSKDDEQLIPLADVPDLVWKTYYKKRGGRDTRVFNGRTNGPEHPTHYADIDEPRPDGRTLRDLCLEDDANISVAFWQQFYDAAGHTKENERGLLPFRVWQFFDQLVEFASRKEPDKFLCAAGLLSHYVGDACQPLHGSRYADGYADRPKKVKHRRRDTGEEYETDSHVGAGVHSTYETKMIDRKSTELVEGIRALLPTWNGNLPPITSGHAAAKAVIHLMDRSATRLPPLDIVEAYIAAGEKETVAVQDALWEQFGEATIETMVDGATVLAAIWTGAWRIGKGQKIANSALLSINPETLKTHYENRKFVPSLNLDEIGAVLI